jgi:hypothetical protein
VVQHGNSLQALGAALLNYQLPVFTSWRWMRDSGGFAISTGPVYQFGGSPGVSRLGYFGGISFHLFNRFYLTPGVHLGEFADFPLGTCGGCALPDNFTITPVKRWTAKFAFGITYRTNSFRSSQAAGSSSSQPTPNASGQGGAAPGATPHHDDTPQAGGTSTQRSQPPHGRPLSGGVTGEPTPGDPQEHP